MPLNDWTKISKRVTITSIILSLSGFVIFSVILASHIFEFDVPFERTLNRVGFGCMIVSLLISTAIHIIWKRRLKRIKHQAWEHFNQQKNK